MEMVYIRRTRGSQIPSCNATISVGTKLPALKIITVALRYAAHEAAELQLHHRFFAQQFEERMKNNAKPGLSRNEELQAMACIHRELQLEPCFIYRLYMVNSIDKYREYKPTEKFIHEIAVYSDGVECGKHLQGLLERHCPDEGLDIESNDGVAKAARLMTQHLFNLEGVAHEDGANCHELHVTTMHLSPESGERGMGRNGQGYAYGTRLRPIVKRT